MATKGKARVVGPFQAVTPPDMGEDEKAAREAKPAPAPSMTPSPEAQKKLEEMSKEAKEKKATDRAYERSLTNPKFANGGYVRAADGCAQRGKTRGKMV
jgi:hypothetical protein